MSSFPIPLTAKQMEVVFQAATISLLGLPSNAYDKVRVGWQSTGQPFPKIVQDVTILRVIEDDDPYNRIRDRKTIANPDVFAPNSLLQIETYTRVWRVFFTVYGPTSFDNARKIRSGMFNDDIHDMLAAQNLYLVTDPSAPVRVPEERDAQWWERVDFSCQYNEAVTETRLVNKVASVEIIVENATGVLTDFTVKGA